jgi:hypothetical protein
MADRLRGDYSIQRRTRRWYMSLYYWSVDTAIVNALILHKQHMEDNVLTNRSTEHMYFRAKLVEHLHMRADQTRAQAAHLSAAAASGVPRLLRVVASTGPDAHFPVFSHATAYPARACCRCSMKSAVMCTSTACGPCSTDAKTKYFCCLSDRNCFLEYHLEISGAV